jgi:polyisoprenoid-binding protein YceI
MRSTLSRPRDFLHPIIFAFSNLRTFTPSMKQAIAIILGVLLIQAAPQQPVFNVSKGTITFSSDAPLEVIKAGSTELKGKIEANKKLFAFSVKINTFKGFNSALQREHFNENYLESSKYPDATFSGKIIEEVDFTAEGNYTVRAKGRLSIHGVAQERIIKSSLSIKKGQISLQSNFTVLLADHNIPIPKVVQEKLASEIKLVVNAVLVPQ